jgi:hypothetical protein
MTAPPQPTPDDGGDGKLYCSAEERGSALEDLQYLLRRAEAIVENLKASLEDSK